MFLYQVFEYFRNWYYGTKAEDGKTASAAPSCGMSAAKVEDAAPTKEDETKKLKEDSDKSTEVEKEKAEAADSVAAK